jgi:uncharacterized protein YggE
LFDQLATINGIVLNGISFELSDKREVFKLAREQAFKDARQKGRDYSHALGFHLGQVLSIKDNVSRPPVVTDGSLKMNDMLVGESIANPTVVNVGTIPISYNVEVTFGFKYQ